MPKGRSACSAAVVAPGLTVMAVILFMGAVSGTHLNPGPALPGSGPSGERTSSGGH